MMNIDPNKYKYEIKKTNNLLKLFTFKIFACSTSTQLLG